MSQSTSRTTPRAGDSNSRFSQEDKREGKWFGWSVLLHVVGLAALILCTPVGDVLLAKSEPKQANLVLSQERAQQLADQIRDLSAEDLQQRVESLQMVDQQMEELRVEQRSKLTDEQVKADEEAPVKALEQMQETIVQMQKTADVIEQKYTNDAVNESLKQVSEKQDKANETLMSAGMEYDQVRRAQKQAIVEQLEVKAWQQQIEQKERDADSLDKQIERTAADAEHQAKSVEATDKRLDETKKHIEEAKQKQEQNSSEMKKVQEQIEAAKKADKTDKKEAAQLKSLERQLDAQQKNAERLDAAVKRDQSTAEKLAEQLDKQQAQLTSKQQKLSELKDQKKQTQADQAHAVEQRKAQQEEAKKKQQEAITTLKTAIAKANTPSSEVAPMQSQTVDATIQRPTTKDPVKLYQQARELEEKITDSYREVRAAELAKIQNMKLAEAMARVDVPEPVRDPVDKTVLDTKVKTANHLQEYKKELAKVDQHMQSMQMSADSMLSAAQQVSQGFSSELATAMTIQRQQALDEMALENSGQKAVDLTGLMTPGGQETTGQAQAQPQGDGKAPQGPNSGKSSGAGRGPAGPGDGVPLLTKDVVALPGRSVGIGGVKSDWMFIDTWWMVGPFANPERKNIHQKFAPETVVDLDAVYVGEGGRPIGWQFVQSKRAFIMPPGKSSYEYSIWYAYTEVRFDRATDMWIAVGSDDRSDIWINGQKVWASSDVLKSWRVDEGYRKVHFQAGTNRILYRIENGWHAMGFSMMLHTSPQSAAPTAIQAN